MKDKLFTRSYNFILAANFLLFFGFWFMMPVLPFYLKEVFHANEGSIGLILACATIASLTIRPFSGYLIDTFARKPLYLISYFVFAMMFVGYIIAGTLTMFVVYRVIFGLAFGTVSVGGNTIVIDIMPSSRRGEGLGYYGLANNVAMSIGPMAGLFMHNGGASFTLIFTVSLLSCLLGFACACMVKTPYKVPVKREPVSLDRFFLLKGIPAGIALLLLSIPYGMTTNYVAMYAQQIGLTVETGFFFSCMAVGIAVSRIFSGKMVDKGKITEVILFGIYVVIVCFFLLGACAELVHWSIDFTDALFLVIALFLGLGFGTMFPAFNTLFINLAYNNQRGTATSTYLTSWDVGISLGMVAGGYIAHISNFEHAYLFGAVLTVVSAFFFRLKVTPHFNKNKVR